MNEKITTETIETQTFKIGVKSRQIGNTEIDENDLLALKELLNAGIAKSSGGAVDARGPIHAEKSDLYFTDTEHKHTGIGNTSGYAAIENAKDFDSLMILGRAGTDKGRKVRLWDYLEINGSLETTGMVKGKSFKIGDTEIDEDDLRTLKELRNLGLTGDTWDKLKKLTVSQQRVFLKSDYGEYVCDSGRKDRTQDGHSRFVIEFE